MNGTGTVTSSGTLWVEKDKGAALNYTFLLNEVLAVGDTLAAVTTSVSPEGQVAVDELAFSGTTIVASLSGGVTSAWYAVRFRWTSVAGQSDEFVLWMFITADAETVPLMGTALFPNRFTATAALRRDRLLTAAKDLTAANDDYLWEKLVAAESTLRHILNVNFQPTRHTPQALSAAEVAALGMPWEQDPGYDYDAAFFQSDRWGFLQLRNKPLISVEAVRVMMPGVEASFDVPASWIRMDRKYAEIQFVPTSEKAGVLPLSAFMLQTVSLGRSVPFSLHVTYTAGLENVTVRYPELIDAARKMAVLSMLEDSHLPQSGSISADGLSQSISFDADKYRDSIETIINGPKGSNGGLVRALHGVRMGVLG